VGELARYKLHLEQRRTRAGGLQAPATLPLALTAVCEFLRFAVAHGHAEAHFAEQLSNTKAGRQRRRLPIHCANTTSTPDQNAVLIGAAAHGGRSFRPPWAGEPVQRRPAPCAAALD
jgi:hypothetical protein